MKKLAIGLLMLTTMVQWPNIILHYNTFIVNFVKPVFIISSIAVFAFLGQKKITAFAGYFTIMLAVSINYSWVNGLFYNSFFVRTLYFVSACALFYKYPILIRQYLRLGILISAFLGFQAFILTILMLGDVTLDYRSVSFIDGGEKEFNWLAGVQNDPNYFRVTSYFTETNRLAYFLTPSLFVSYHFAKTSLFSRLCFLAILFGIVSTFSVFSFFAITVAATFYIVYVRRMSLKYLLIVPGCAVFIIAIYSLAPEYFTNITDKSGSLQSRLLGIEAKMEMITGSPFGFGEAALAAALELLPAGNSTLTMLHWAVVGGVQAVLLLLILLIRWALDIVRLSRVSDGYSSFLACGMLASLLEQSFYGTYFEYYFLTMMAVVSAAAKSNRKSSKTVYAP